MIPYIHIKTMKVFDSLSVVDDPVSEEDRVVHLLASLVSYPDPL